MDINIKHQPTDRELGIEKRGPNENKRTSDVPNISENIRTSDVHREFEPPKMLFYWRAVSRWALILFAGLAPIFFLPFTQLPVAVHKELLIFALVLVALFALLGKILIEGKIRYPGHFLAAALAILVLVWGASTFFSVNPLTSLLGNFSTADSFASILIFAILAFTAVMTFDRRDIIVSILVFLASLSLLGVFELLQLVKVFALPWSFAQNNTFNPIGTVNDLGILLAFGLVIASGMMATPEMSKLLKKLLGISVVILMINLIVIDFWAIWVGLVLAMIFMISFLSIGLTDNRSGSTQIEADQRGNDYLRESANNPHESASMPEGLQLIYFQKAWLPSIILLVAALLLIIPSPLSRFIQTPAEVSPNFSATLNIASENLKSGHYLLGSGPNTFGYAFNLYKPIGINQTIFWSTIFTSGASAMATWAVTSGILGILTLLFLIIAFIWTGITGTSVRNASKGIMNVASQSVFVAVIFLFIMWFLYVANFTVMAFTFWGMGLFLAASLFFIMENKRGSAQIEADQRGSGDFPRESAGNSRKSAFREIRIFTSPPKTFLFSLLIVGLMVGAAAGIYFEANRYIAELYFGKGIASTGTDIGSAAVNVSKAIDLWPYDERYFETLAQLIFLQLNDLLSKKDLPQEELRTRFQNITTNAIAAAKRAEELNPKNPFNEVLLGSIYENLMPFIADASNFALSSYGAATALDPKNPSHYLGMARVQISKNELDKAVSNLEEALNLKNDYAPARFLLVQVFDRQGKLSDAIKRAEELVSLNVNDVGALFQLGFLYYKNNQFNESKLVFERVVSLSPNYSNARYFLGLIYDGSDKAKALEQFEKIAELNPDNVEIKQIIANLAAKKAALFGIAPPAPAPQNRQEVPVQEGKAPIQKLKK